MGERNRQAEFGFHSLGQMLDFPVFVQFELLQQAGKQRFVPFRAKRSDQEIEISPLRLTAFIFCPLNDLNGAIG